MTRTLRLFSTILVLSVSAAAAGALSPREVAVVANAKSADSVALAKLYIKLRGIPEENLVLVGTTTKYKVSRLSYEAEILKPVRKALTDRKLADRIRCLCLMWGVPVRVAGADAKRLRGMKAVYATAAKRHHYRLATAYDLLKTVAIKFPAPKTDALKPLGKLFGGLAKAPTEPLEKLLSLLNRIPRLLQLKHKEAAALDDAGNKKIAERQFMAIVLEIQGLRGLIKYLSGFSPADAPKMDKLQNQLDEAMKALKGLKTNKPTAETARALLAQIQKIDGCAAVAIFTAREAKRLKVFGYGDAAVDSELALLWWGDYDPIGIKPNPLNWRRAAQLRGKKYPPTLMTARIDGPSIYDVKRIINDSFVTEKTGLTGTFYIDIGKKYAYYDKHLKALADFVRKNVDPAGMKVVLDEQKALFKPGACPDAALYIGWYSLGKYVPAFTWKPGAVGWHIASVEAADLRNAASNKWCVKMIQRGVTATLGPVAEPYLQAFPRPDEFFPLLLTGKYTLAECYWRTVPTASWRMTLIGDPLYNPFAKKPLLKVEALPPGLAP